MQEIRDIAKDHGIKTARISKPELIKQIQRSEGNFDCFASAESGQCDQLGCRWREDCLTLAKKASKS
jgi:hypothetical protein